jgi:putative aldouronate transport system permease protein
MLNFYGLLLGFPAPIILALVLNEVRKQSLKRVFQSISYLPYFISTIVIVGIMMRLFSTQGVVNDTLNAFGIKSQLFFNDPKWFRTLYVGSGIWQSSGYSAIIYLAAISGINVEQYESAVLDGANRWKQMLHITLPGIAPTIRILLILSMGHIMSVGFDKVFLMQNPGIYETSDVIATYIYRRGIVDSDYSFSTAVGLFNALIAFVFIASANYISKKTSGDSLW